MGMIINPYRFGGAKLLLDTYTGAAAAYSFRKLRTEYTGYCIKVIRSSDSTEQDIGFVNNVLDESALSTFCSGTNGFISTWYDQSGNGYSLTNTDAGKYPQIVNSGTIIKINGKPSTLNSTYGSKRLFYNNTDVYLSKFIGNTLLNTIVSVCNPAINGYDYIFRFSGNNVGYLGAMTANADNKIIYSVGTMTNVVQADHPANFLGYQNLLSFYSNGTTQYIRRNNNELASANNSNSYSNFSARWGIMGDVTYSFNGYFQEAIIWALNKGNDISAIEDNVNSFYSIY